MSQHSSQVQNYKFTRRVKRRYQARVWDGRIRAHINLGCYGEDRAAWDAAKRFIRRGELPSHVLPYFVRHQPDGTFAAGAIVCGSESREVRRVGPFETPCEAHIEMLFDLLRLNVGFGTFHPRRMLTAENPAVAAWCVFLKPHAWLWPNDVAEVIDVRMVDECKRRIDIGSGYAEAARRWANSDYTPEVDGPKVIRLPRVVIGRKG